jgi:hypothetical protein
MDYALTVDRRAGYLHVKVAGDNNRETVRRYMSEVHALCNAEGHTRVLIEEDLHGPSLSTAAIYGVIQQQAQQAGPLERKVAFVDVNPQHDHDLMKFAETVAVNRGVEVCVFQDVPTAARWLTADLAPQPGADQPS